MQAPPSVQGFIDCESELRAKHGTMSLYARPRVVPVPRAKGGSIALAGWAFLDGEPAMLSEELDLIILSFDGAGGMTNYPRAAATVFEVLTPYLTRHTAPCPHLTIHVPEADKASLRAFLTALPDHDGIAPPPPLPTLPNAQGPLVPILKPGTWPHRVHMAHLPLIDRPDAPIVVFAHDLPTGYAFVPAGGADLSALWAEATRNLSARASDFTILDGGVAVCAGRELSAERLIDPAFMRTLHEKGGADLLVGVPHRVALYAIATNSATSTRAQLAELIRFEHKRGPEQGHAPVTTTILRVVNGQVVDTMSLEQMVEGTTAPAAPAAAAEPASPPPTKIRYPHELVLVNAETKVIEASVVLVGSGAKGIARALHATTGGAKLGNPQVGELEHIVLTLGAIRGWTTRLFLYSVDGSFDSIVSAGPRLVSEANAVVLAQGTPGTLAPELFAMSKATKASALLAFVGPVQALDELVAGGGGQPSVVSHDGERGAVEVLKAITKHVLASLSAG